MLLTATEETDAGPKLDTSGAVTIAAASKRNAINGVTVLGGADIAYRRGHYQIYFSGSGSLALGLMLSSDAKQFWNAGSVLNGVPGSGLDDSGVLDPDVVDDDDVLRLFYTAYTIDKQSQSIQAHWQVATVSRSSGAVCSGRDCGEHSDCAPAAKGGKCVCDPGFVHDDAMNCVMALP